MTHWLDLVHYVGTVAAFAAAWVNLVTSVVQLRRVADKRSLENIDR